MKGRLYDGLFGAVLVSVVIFALCGRVYPRRCLHCKEITYYVPTEGNKTVAARESVLDIVIRKWSNVEVLHMHCANEHDFSGGCDCGS